MITRINRRKYQIYAMDVESHNDLESIKKRETSIWLGCFIDETSKVDDESSYFYTIQELTQVVSRTAKILDIKITEEGASAIAKRSRGTPRIANRLIKRVADFAIVKYDGIIDDKVANESLDILKIDEFGLDNTDRALLNLIIEKYDGGPVGVETIAAALSEDVRTIEDVCEPYLLQAGLIQRTPRGRKVSPEGYRHLGLKTPSKQKTLFDF